MTQRLSLMVIRLLSILVGFLAEFLRFGRGLLRPRASLVAENLFLKKQLAFYRERHVAPRRLTDTAKLSLLLWSRWFDWRNALMVVKPETLIGWHRRAFQIFWRWKSRGGRSRLPKNLRALIAEMVWQNPTWGQARVASELALKLGVRVSPRTVRAYWPETLPTNRGRSSQRWASFVRNHAKAMVACDFVVAVTLRFRVLYVFVAMEIGSRKLLHVNVTSHPTSSWTVQQLREAIPSDHSYRWLIHDRSGIFSWDLDRDVEALGIAVLKTPVRAPKANAHCERLIGSLRRECLDWFIPVNERHVRMLAREWAVTTTRHGRTAVWDQAFQTLRQGCRWRGKFTDTMFQRVSQSRRSRSWAGCITNIALRGLRHDPDKVLAHHRSPVRASLSSLTKKLHLRDNSRISLL